ncbi:sensor histidine kinase [Phenylobacterium sp.]|uniref:sensor histidine kinase n=1 Tax=Phenylobacterium sp. TaxID=1871053 RepID=UPI0027343E7C|nr:sensor histidine kinase [Phenylobacterium sp.]MDP3658790.1 sensor histidine kinase [Phenylobacterium sp.]
MSAQSPGQPDIALGLALAVVAASTVPLLLLDGDLTVVAASGSFCRAFDIDEAGVSGESIFALGAGEWNMPRLRSLLTATAAGSAEIAAYEIDLERPGRPPRKLMLNAHKLVYAGGADARMLLTVSDVTDARAADKLKDDLLREKAILLREVQHRVANSLQIIASVLLQNARTVQSDETRKHLHEAHGRVMSIAAVQQQLATSSVSEVRLRAYFEQLCSSLAASMIQDPKQISLQVTSDDTAVPPETSISLGLIVTELVINALKHAFPGRRSGQILVDYAARGDDWTLSVGDDGVGIAQAPAGGKPGLGTNIIEALAAQLQARVEVGDASPGTTVSIVHDAAALESRTAAPAVAARHLI